LNGSSVRDGDRMKETPETPIEQRSIGITIGKTMALLSLITAGVGFFLYYTINEIDASLLAFAGFTLADIWRLSGLLLLGSAGAFLRSGPARGGDLFGFLRYLDGAILILAGGWLVVWMVSVVPVQKRPFGDPETLARSAALFFAVALVVGAISVDFRNSIWVQRHRNVLLNSGALLLGLLAAFGIAEWGMRNIFRPPIFSPLFAKSAIPGCEFEMKPGFDGPCGNVHVRLNSDGFHSPEISPQKTRKRVLTIGDSVTFGAWVEQDRNFPAVLQQLLGTDRYEVINAGVPAYHLTQVTALFEQKGVRYQPDIVIYTFVYDDINDPLILDSNGILLEGQGRRYGGKVAITERFRFFPLPRRLVGRSHLLTAVVMRYYRFREGRYFSGDRDLFADLLAERWGWLEQRLVELRAAVEKAGARFLLVIFPVGLSEQSTERLMAMARKNGIEAVELRTVLGDARNYAAKYMTPWDAHPNAAAHALMAQAIADRLVAARFVEPPISSGLDRTTGPTDGKHGGPVGQNGTRPSAPQR